MPLQRISYCLGYLGLKSAYGLLASQVARPKHPSFIEHFPKGDFYLTRACAITVKGGNLRAGSGIFRICPANQF